MKRPGTPRRNFNSSPRDESGEKDTSPAEKKLLSEITSLHNAVNLYLQFLSKLPGNALGRKIWEQRLAETRAEIAKLEVKFHAAQVSWRPKKDAAKSDVERLVEEETLLAEIETHLGDLWTRPDFQPSQCLTLMELQKTQREIVAALRFQVDGVTQEFLS